MNGVMGEMTTSDRLRAISLIDPKTIKKPVIPAQDNSVVPLKGLFKGVKGQQTVSPSRDVTSIVVPQYKIEEPVFGVTKSSGRMMINKGQFQPRSNSGINMYGSIK
jgi:hypothetical protein